MQQAQRHSPHLLAWVIRTVNFGLVSAEGIFTGAPGLHRTIGTVDCTLKHACQLVGRFTHTGFTIQANGSFCSTDATSHKSGWNLQRTGKQVADHVHYVRVRRGQQRAFVERPESVRPGGAGHLVGCLDPTHTGGSGQRIGNRFGALRTADRFQHATGFLHRGDVGAHGRHRPTNLGTGGHDGFLCGA
ncbi:hypothetical protein D3C85_1131140 [compost metagenome]